MTGCEWKPGDVAVTGAAFEGEVAIRFLVTSKGFHYEDGDFTSHPPREDARPLVVIDPEDREQVERLIRALSSGQPIVGLDPTNRETVDAAWMNHTQAALRSLTEPPKPPEPTGLGAVVEDAEGERWLRWEIVGRHPKPWTVAGSVKPNRGYADIDAVKVLSEGVVA